MTDVPEHAPPEPDKNYWPAGPDEHLEPLSNGAKVKRRMLRMRACTERDAKNKMCRGHIKRWFEFPDEVKQRFGADAELYRCERCKTIYLPNPAEPSRTLTMSW